MLGDKELSRLVEYVILAESRPAGTFTSIPFHLGGIPDLSGSTREFHGFIPVASKVKKADDNKRKGFILDTHPYDTPERNVKKSYYYWAALLDDDDNPANRTVVYTKAPTTFSEGNRQKKLADYLFDEYGYDRPIVKEVRVSPGLIDMIGQRDCTLEDHSAARQLRWEGRN